MTCKHCHDLSLTWRAPLADGFDYLLALVHGEVNVGTLRETPHLTTLRGRRPPPFESLTADGDFDGESFAYEFLCVFCGERFTLRIDGAARMAEWRSSD